MTSVCSVANGLKGVYSVMEEKERSRKRASFSFAFLLFWKSIQARYEEQREHHPIKGKQGVKTYAFQC